MEHQSKISSRKVKRFAVVSLVLIIFSAILIAANRKQSDKPIAGTRVTLKHQDREENFLKTKDVEELISKQGINVDNQTIASINVDEIERIVRSNPWINDAQVFVDNKGTLNIEVTQRLPVARIFANDGTSFYIDTAGFEMPLSQNYAYSVPVFTNYAKQANDSINEHNKKSMVYLSSIIKEDSFWNAQITQVDMEGLNNFNFYTTLGRQKVKFGDTSAAVEKLDNLMAFYKDVSNKIGWDRYNVLDVRFKGQVLATPSIGWVPPKDTVAEAPVANPAPVAVAQNVVAANPKPAPAKPKEKPVPEKKPEPAKKAPAKVVPKKKEEPKKAAAKPVAKTKAPEPAKAKTAAAKKAEADKNKKDKKK